MLPVTSLAAVVLTGVFLRYSALIIRRRRALGIAVFDGGDIVLGRLIRAQANLAEYGLLLVMLTGLCEMASVPPWWLAVLVTAFFAGRVSHGYGLVMAEPDDARGSARFRWRVAGMVLTFVPMACTAATLLGALLWAAL